MKKLLSFLLALALLFSAALADPLVLLEDYADDAVIAYDPDNPDEIIHDSKLFGYINDEQLKASRALRWLIENHKLDDYDPEDRTADWIWNYGASHEMFLRHDEFIEFITRYVMDRNDFYFANTEYHDEIDYYEAALRLPWVKVGWY